MTAPRSYRRIATLVCGVALLIASLFSVEAFAVSKNQVKSTYGITSTFNAKKGTTKSKALNRPGKITYSTPFDQVKVKGINNWQGWGTSEAVGTARKVTICEDGDCVSSKGTVTFDDPSKRKCRVGKKKKNVTLYGMTYFEREDDGQPGLLGISAQYATSGKPACPKF